jgi:hypothetical protein
MKNWLTELLLRKQTRRDLAMERVLEADDWNRFERNRMNPVQRKEIR